MRKKQRALKRKPGEEPAWNGWHSGPWGGGWGPKPTNKPTKSPISAWEAPAWNGKWNWDGNKWNWSWGGGWGPKPTKKPTSWDSSWSSGKGPSSWGWGGDTWAGNGWGSTVASDEPSLKPSLSLEPSKSSEPSNKPSLEPSTSLMPSLSGGYYDYLYEEFCLDLVFEAFPYVAFESNRTQALNDPHGYCAEKCNNCVFAEGLVPEEQFKGIVHEVFNDDENVTMGCGCQYDVAVYDNGTFNGTCAYNDPEFWFEDINSNGTGPVFQGPLPVRRELAPNNNFARKGSKFWFGAGSSTLSQEGGDEDDLACYQWIARATD